MEITFKNERLYVIIPIRFLSIAFCYLVIDLPSYIEVPIRDIYTYPTSSSLAHHICSIPTNSLSHAFSIVWDKISGNSRNFHRGRAMLCHLPIEETLMSKECEEHMALILPVLKMPWPDETAQ